MCKVWCQKIWCAGTRRGFMASSWPHGCSPQPQAPWVSRRTGQSQLGDTRYLRSKRQHPEPGKVKYCGLLTCRLREGRLSEPQSCS